MVRIGTLPMRLLALEYGASEVYSPEIVDKSILSCKRIFNALIGTWDYVLERDPATLIFRTHPKERSKLIFQIGSADPKLAVEAALKVSQDAAGINLNCGCPKRFSLQGGMGAALLKEPERLLSILRALVAHSDLKHLPISCKIRIFPTVQETIDLCERIIQTGIHTLIIHCRTPAQTPKDPGNLEALRELGMALRGKVRLVANGDFFTAESFSLSGLSMFFDEVMFARAAMRNPSIFLAQPFLEPLESVSRKYLNLCFQTQNALSNSKFVLLSMWEPSSEVGKQILASKCLSDLGKVFGCEANLGELQAQSVENDELPYVPNHSVDCIPLDLNSSPLK